MIKCGHIKKARESVPVTRPATQGLRIAQFCWTGNAEAHADMYNNTHHALPWEEGHPHDSVVWTYHADIYRCFALDYDLKVAKFQTVKRQNVSKRLSLINISPQPLPDFNNLKHRRGKCDKDTEKKTIGAWKLLFLFGCFLSNDCWLEEGLGESSQD